MHRYGKIFFFDECYAVHTFVQSSKDASDYDEYSLFFFTFFSFLSQFVYTVRWKLSLKFPLVTPSHAGKLNTNTWINRK